MTTRPSAASRSIELVQALDSLMRRRLAPVHSRRGLDIALTRLDVRVLSAAGSQREWSMGHLAGETGLSGSGLTAVVDRLVERGLLERRRSDQDRRVVRVGLTARGRHLHEQAREHRRRFAEAMLAPLDDREQTLFLELMHKIAQAGQPPPGRRTRP